MTTPTEPSEKDMQTAREICGCNTHAHTMIFETTECDRLSAAIARAISQARQEERERCAGIAEKRFTCECTDSFCRGTVNAAKIIAAAIRAGEGEQ